jgi:hypothetical protein
MKQHSLDPWSLIGGGFLALVGLLFLIPAQPFDITDGFREFFGWAFPVLVVAAGLALIGPALRRARTQEPPAPPADLSDLPG